MKRDRDALMDEYDSLLAEENAHDKTGKDLELKTKVWYIYLSIYR